MTVYGTPTNVIVGVAQLFIAPANTAMIPATTPQGTAWPTPWVSAGFTESGITFNVDRKTVDINVEEQSTPVDVVVETTTVTIDAVLAEDTLATMINAYGGGTLTVTAPVTGSPGSDGYTTLTLSDTLEQLSIGFEAVNTFGLWRRVYIPLVVSGAKVKTQYQRAKAPRTYTVTFTAICPINQIQIMDATAV